jgi:uncharacterized protein with beta-barrel porin domain
MQRNSLRAVLIASTALTAASLFAAAPSFAQQIIAGGGNGGSNAVGLAGAAGGSAGGGGGDGGGAQTGGSAGNAGQTVTGLGGAPGIPNDPTSGGGGGGGASSSADNGGAGGIPNVDSSSANVTLTGNQSGGSGGVGGLNPPTTSGGGGGGGGGLVLEAPNVVFDTGGFNLTGGEGGMGESGGGGGVGLLVTNGGTGHVSSTSTITGGTGGAATAHSGGGGGAGIFFAQGGTFTNDGIVFGGTGGASQSSNGATGGAGVLGNNATVINNGQILGGGGGTNSGMPAGVGGSGVELWGGTLTNNSTGVIDGGQSGALSGEQGNGGDGVLIRSGGASVIVTNFGLIEGRYNAHSTGTTGSGGVGIVVDNDGSTVINAGRISGGLNSDRITTAKAMTITGTNDRLELWKNYAFTGIVDATAGTNATLAFGGTDNASFDVSQIGSTAQFQGFSSLDKSGTSTWTLTGTSTFTGPMTVNGGTLLVNGDASTFSSMTVNAGATLGGSGTVGTTMINGGTLTGGTGDANGLLNVNGSLTFTAASTYLVQVSPSSASQVSATGSATLAGAGVNAVFASGSYVSKQYTILTAAGGVSGTFSGPVNTNLPTSFTSALAYDSKNAYLNLTLNFTAPSGGGGTPESGSGSGGAPAAVPFGSGLNGNQQHVANALVNSFNANGGIPLALGSLTPQGLTQSSGETATGAQQTTFDAMNLFMGLMSDPTEHGTTPAPSSPAQAYAEMPTKAFPRFEPAFTPGWSTWASGFGGSQTTDGNSGTGSNDVTSRIFGGAAGADYHLAPDALLGFAMMGGGTNFSVANGGTGLSDLFQAGAFGRQNFGAGYVSAALAYGWQDITTDRYVVGNHLHAEFDANSYSGRIEGGYRFTTLDGLGVTPYGAAQVTVFDLPSYAEQAIGGGLFALNYDSKDVTDTRSELGFRADRSFVVGDAILTLRGRAAWAHDFDTDRSVSATFQTLPGASFIVNGAAMAPDSALITASAETTWRNGWSVAATFDGEFSDVTASYAAKGVVRYAW